MLLSKRDPVTAELANLKKKSDAYQSETKRLFQEQSPMNRMLAEIRAKNDESFQYRLRILHNVPTFAGFGDTMLRSIAESMEVLTYVAGDDIIVQNDIGDAFFVLEQGRVKVMRKGNAYEIAHEIRQLSPGAHFGELSLLSDEPRSATITVISETARALKLSRQSFEETVKSLKTLGIKPKEIDSKTIVEKVPLFKSLSTALKKKIEETMQLMHFPAEHYICKQGGNGTTFYILTSGSCRITIDTADYKEKEVNKIYPGDYFGEAALVEAGNVRTANVIAMEPVSCMSLSKAEFNYLLKSVKTVLVQQREKKRLTDMQALGRLRYGEEHNKKGTVGTMDYIRRISTMNVSGQRVVEKGKGYVKCIMRYMFESLQLSMYSRMYRMLILRELASLEYGNQALAIRREHTNLQSASAAIRVLAMEILSKNLRTDDENLFISGLLRQRNALKDELCAMWAPHKFNDLCRKVTGMRYKATRRIYDIGSRGNVFFLILRGCVRLFGPGDDRTFAQVQHEDSKYEVMHKNIKYERDLFPGEIFGIEVLKGERVRKITALAMTAVDCVVIEADSYMAAQDTTGGMSLEERVEQVQQMSLFNGWDQYRLYKVAANCTEQMEFQRGSVIINSDEITNKFYILLSGDADVLTSVHSTSPLNALSKFDYFGESGFLNNNLNTKPAHGRYTETFCIVAKSRVQVMVFPESEYHLIDGITALKILELYNIRKTWREQRTKDVFHERRVFRELKKSVFVDVTKPVIVTATTAEHDQPSPRAGALDRISQIIREARIEQSQSSSSHHHYQSPSSSSALSIESHSSHSSSPTKSKASPYHSPSKLQHKYGHKHISSNSSSQYSLAGPETSSLSPTHSSFSSSTSWHGSPNYHITPTPMPNTFHSEGPPVAVPHLTTVHPSLSPMGVSNNSIPNPGIPLRSYGTSYHPPSYPPQHANLSQLGLYNNNNNMNPANISSHGSIPSNNSINNSVLTDHFPESSGGAGMGSGREGQEPVLSRKPSMSLSVNSMQSESENTTASPMIALNAQLSSTLDSMLSVYKSQQYAKMNAPRFVHEHTKSTLSSSTTDGSTTPSKSPTKSPAKQSTATTSFHLSSMSEQIPPEALNVPLKKTQIQNYKSVTTKVRLEDLEDIPSLVNGGFNPFMVVACNANPRNITQAIQNVNYLRLPKCARAKVSTRANGRYYRDVMAQPRSHLISDRGILSVSEQAIADYQESRVRDYNMAFIEGLGMGGHDSDSELSDGPGDEDSQSNEEMSISTQATRLSPGLGGYQEVTIPSPQGIAPPQIGTGQGQETLPRTVTPFSGENIAITPHPDDPLISVSSPGSQVDTPMTDAGTVTSDVLALAALELLTERHDRDTARDTDHISALDARRQGPASTTQGQGHDPTTARTTTSISSTGTQSTHAMSTITYPGAKGLAGNRKIITLQDSLARMHINPDEYVGVTGLEKHMLFGTGQIPSVNSYVHALRGAERGPFRSNIRSEVTDAQIRNIDELIEAQLDYQRQESMPIGPRVTRVDREQRRNTRDISPTNSTSSSVSGHHSHSHGSSSMSHDLSPTSRANQRKKDAERRKSSKGSVSFNLLSGGNLALSLGLTPIPKPKKVMIRVKTPPLSNEENQDMSHRTQSRERAHSSRGSQLSYDSEYSDEGRHYSGDGRTGSGGEFNVRDSPNDDFLPSTYDDANDWAGMGVTPQAPPLDYESSLIAGELMS